MSGSWSEMEFARDHLDRSAFCGMKHPSSKFWEAASQLEEEVDAVLSTTDFRAEESLTSYGPKVKVEDDASTFDREPWDLLIRIYDRKTNAFVTELRIPLMDQDDLGLNEKRFYQTGVTNVESAFESIVLTLDEAIKAATGRDAF